MRVTLKLATSLDGRIATATGESKWITGELAREQGHRLRSAHDAILVGVETVLADDPQLTVRISNSAHPGESRDPVFWATDAASHAQPPIPDTQLQQKDWAPAFAGVHGVQKQPLRVILDSRLRTPDTAKIATANTLILTATEPRPIGAAEVQQIAAENGRPTIAAILTALADRNITSLLIEGGGQVAASFLAAGAVDAIEWFRAPILLGAEGRPCVAGLALANLADAPKFRRLSAEPLGDDLWERYEAIR